MESNRRHHRSKLAHPQIPLVVDDTLHFREVSKEVEFVDHAKKYSHLTDDEMIQQNGGKLPWDHHLKSDEWLEERAPKVIHENWLEPKNKPQLGMTGRVRSSSDFDTLDLKWLNPIQKPTNDEELEEFNKQKKRRAKDAYAWGHEDAVMSVDFSPDGNYLASVGCDGRCCIWEYKSGKCLRNLTHHDQWVLCVKWSEDQSLLVTSSADSCIRIWRTEDWVKIKELQNVHTKWTNVVQFLPSPLEKVLGRHPMTTLVSGSNDRSIVVWGLASVDWPILQMRKHGSWVTDVAIREDGIIASGSSDTKVRLWRLRRPRGSTDCNQLVLDHLIELPTDAWVTSLCFLSDDRVACATKGNYICLWRVNDNIHGQAHNMLKKIYGAHSMKCINTIKWCQPYLVTGGEDKVVAFYDPEKMIVKCLGNGRSQRLIGHPGPIYDMSFNPDGTLIATCAEDCSVRVWNLASRVALRKFEHRQDDSWKKML
jgi:WD40 repeat protein